MGPININTDGMWTLMTIGLIASAIVAIVSIAGVGYVLYKGIEVICCG